jgi:hypothetical protein
MKIDLQAGTVEFLKPTDLSGDTAATIRRVEMKQIHDRFAGGKAERMLGYFELDSNPGVLRSLILNRTIQRQLALAIGDDETDNWPGTKVVLFPTTASNGKPCIRAKGVSHG